MPLEGNPLVSVIMPVFNAEEFIQQAVISILEQTHKNLELIIIDDGSTDQSWQKISLFSDERILQFRNKENIGYLKTVNKAFEIASGDYIAFQDADDWSRENRIEQQVELLQLNKIVALCGTQCEFVEKDKKSTSFYPLSDEDIRHWLNKGENSVFCGAALMIRREVLVTVGGYDELFDRIGSEDLDWYLRILKEFVVCNLDQVLYFYRQTSGSITRHASVNPLRYHSAEMAVSINSSKHVSAMSREDAFRNEQERITEHYNASESIYAVAGLNQLLLGDVKSYFFCGSKLRLEGKGSYWGVAYYYLMFLPLLLIGKLSVRNKKKLFRVIKVFKSGIR